MSLRGKSDTIPTRVTEKGFRKGWRPANKGKTFPDEVLSPAEVRSLLNWCSRRAPTGIRNRALLTVLSRAGLRCQEALDILPKDIDQKRGTLTVLRGKGGKRRVVGMDPEAFEVLDRWLDKRRELGLTGRHPVFATLERKPMHSSYVRSLVRRLGEKAGIEKRVHPHGLRAFYATELERKGLRLRDIADLLGHSNVATTDTYLRRLGNHQAIEAARKLSWSEETTTTKDDKSTIRELAEARARLEAIAKEAGPDVLDALFLERLRYLANGRKS